MFASIAHRYDLANHLLSMSMDKVWRRFTRRQLAPFAGRDANVLDLCTGTGDLAFEFVGAGRVIGCDFCHPMLVRASEKKGERRLAHGIEFVGGDVLRLPFPRGRFDVVTMAFGLRNLEFLENGLAEINRVMKVGARLAILEFSLPRWPVYREVYLFYFTRILPKLGALVSGREGPYSYLPQSVREFPSSQQLVATMQQHGFESRGTHPLTGGIATLYLVEKIG